MPDLTAADFVQGTLLDGNSLWRKAPDAYNSVRSQLMGICTPNSIRFDTASPGTVVEDKDGPTKAFVQPTLNSCNLATFMTATQDLLSHMFEGNHDPINQFDHIIGHFLTSDERESVLKRGMNLDQFTDFSNRVFEKSRVGWTATALTVPKLTFDELQILLGQPSDSRFVTNYGARLLYGLEGTTGHFGYIDAVTRNDTELAVTIAETAPYRYPERPVIPLRELYEAMSQKGSDGTERGIVMLSPISDLKKPTT